MKLLNAQMLRSTSKASVVGLHLVSAVFVGSAIGWFLDDFFGSFFYLTTIFLILGIVAGFYNVWLDTKKIIADQKKQK